MRLRHTNRIITRKMKHPLDVSASTDQGRKGRCLVWRTILYETPVKHCQINCWRTFLAFLASCNSPQGIEDSLEGKALVLLKCHGSVEEITGSELWDKFKLDWLCWKWYQVGHLASRNKSKKAWFCCTETRAFYQHLAVDESLSLINLQRT